MDLSIIHQINPGITGRTLVPVVQSAAGIDETDLMKNLIRKRVGMTVKDDVRFHASRLFDHQLFGKCIAGAMKHIDGMARKKDLPVFRIVKRPVIVAGYGSEGRKFFRRYQRVAAVKIIITGRIIVQDFMDAVHVTVIIGT